MLFWQADAQVNFSANDQITPYDSYFHPSANIGEYTSFSENTLAELAAGNDLLNVPGVGVKALRPGLFEGFLEAEGYGASLPTFEFYKTLGMEDHTVIVGFPSDAHRETEEYCDGFQSELFANLYEPIWDGGANGTPINEDNYYALYMWKMVSTYKDYVRFWEIWNEPGFDYTGGLGFLPPGAPGNWWDNNPNPCDYKLRAPIFHYVRLLRISWEVIKTIDPEAYVVVSGTGYPSFLDAILRNTDNPDDGSVSSEFPLQGGAYFDVMGFHSYPHFDGSLQEWSDQLNDWIYSRHSDGAAQGLVKTKEAYEEVLSSYGYDGTDLPEKLWMVTEVNLPRKQFDDYIGSEEAQRNFMIKAMATAMMNDFLQLHIYKLAEDTGYETASSEFDLMGLYKQLDYSDLYFQEMNDEGIAHKTASDILYGKIHDPVRTAALNLPPEVGGGAFADEDGNYTYVLWATTQTDMSEVANASYFFPSDLNINQLIQCDWDAGISHKVNNVEPNNIQLTGTPQFFTEALFTLSDYSGCVPFELQTENLVAGAVNQTWTVYHDGNLNSTSNLANPVFFFGASGDYEIVLEAFDGSGQLIAIQRQEFVVNNPINPSFDYEISGPVVHFQNQSPFGNNTFVWDFGDGTSSTDPVPTHVYLNSGTYTVTLTATNECGNKTISTEIVAVSPTTTQLDFTANDMVPEFKGDFRPGISWEYVNGWTDEQLANLAAGNLMDDVTGAGLKSIRTYIGESFFIDQGYEVKKDLFDHYDNISLEDNTFLLAFPSVQSRDPYFYCPDQQSAMFKDLYLEIWDNGENGTPVNDDNPWALYVYNTVKNYGPYVKYWEIYNSPDFDLTGDRGWLPPGEPGNWWDNNPDPCEYELRAPIFYYIRSLRIAYEIIKHLDEEDYVTISGIAFQSFLDAVCRNTDNPINGSESGPYPLKGGAYFDAVGFKSYPHFDGSTIFFDETIGNFAYERHSDAAVSGIPRVKDGFQTVLSKYGYDGVTYPKKEFIISEANAPRRQLNFFFGGNDAQVNWTIKAWVESVRNDIHQLNFFRLAESHLSWLATDPFQVMGLYQKMEGVTPYNQTINDQGVTLKTCSNLLFASDLNIQETEAMLLPDDVDGAAFQDANGNIVYVLWAKTATDLSETASATYTFPASFNIDELYKFEWDYSQTGVTETIEPDDIELTGEPIFLSIANSIATAPVAGFKVDTMLSCVGQYLNFTNASSGGALNWEWSFEGGVPDTHFGETPPPILYEQSGVFDVSLKVTNSAGEHEVVLEELIKIDQLPKAEFDFAINGAYVEFDNQSEHAASYEWCYGDGICNSAESPTYLYFQNGEYTVTLTAFSGCGTSTYEQTILIESVPTAAFSFQPIGDCNSTQVIMQDYSFSGPESWEWIIPDGTPTTSAQQFPTIGFPHGGEFEVTLIAGNDIGFDTLTETIYVEGPMTQEIDVNLCEGGTYEGMQFFSDTTIISEYTTSLLECDSIIEAHINITDNVTAFDFIEICEGGIINGTPIYNDTFIVYNLTSHLGCDSTLTVDITVHPHEVTFLMESIEAGEVYEVGDEEFDQTGNYNVLLETVNGCDSLVNLQLTVLVDLEEELQQVISLNAYPNPFTDQLNIEFELPTTQPISIELYDVNGKLIKRLLSGQPLTQGQHRFTWDKRQIGAGVFLLKLKTHTGIYVDKVIGL